jgi:hypothetical protein
MSGGGLSRARLGRMHEIDGRLRRARRAARRAHARQPARRDARERDRRHGDRWRPHAARQHPPRLLDDQAGHGRGGDDPGGGVRLRLDEPVDRLLPELAIARSRSGRTGRWTTPSPHGGRSRSLLRPSRASLALSPKLSISVAPGRRAEQAAVGARGLLRLSGPGSIDGAGPWLPLAGGIVTRFTARSASESQAEIHIKELEKTRSEGDRGRLPQQRFPQGGRGIRRRRREGDRPRGRAGSVRGGGVPLAEWRGKSGA